MPTKPLTQPGYIARLIENELSECLQTFGAVEIDGPKWCGKTWTALAHAASSIHLDEKEIKQLVKADLSLALQGEKPHLIDEWQEVPSLRDAVRREVDKSGNEPGSFLLTGSTNPIEEGEGTEEVIHSGAGRIAQLRMRPMSLAETGKSTGQVSLAALFDNSFTPTQRQTNLEELADYVCRGGWPAVREMDIKRALRVARQYLESLYGVSARRAGKDGATVRRLVKSLSRNLGSSASYATLISDIAQGEETERASRMSQTTLTSYLAFLENLYVLESLEGWDAPVRARARVRTKPKRYLVDPSLAAASLGITPEKLLSGDLQTFELLFEALCIRDLRVYASAHEYLGEHALKYYRDDYGLEVDVIVEHADGRWGAIEIKLSENKVQDGIESLLRLEKKVAQNDAANSLAPAFKMVLVGRSQFARLSPEGVYVVPVACLGA